MVRTAKALPVGQVVLRAAVPDFLDVVGEHSVRWLSLGAPAAMLDRLATTVSSSYYLVAPLPILRREVERIGCLRLRLHGTRIE